MCDNMADHLIGNVYIKFSDEEEAAAALTALNGRWYAGRQVSAAAKAAAAARQPAARAAAPHARAPPRAPRRSSPSSRP